MTSKDNSRLSISNKLLQYKKKVGSLISFISLSL